jgi:hypothetical protein
MAEAVYVVHAKGCSCPMQRGRCAKIPAGLELEVRKIEPGKLRLEPGKFYEARNGGKWCCFRVNLTREEHCQADCVNVDEGWSEIEYFYLDGRYDGSGESGHTLVRECAP